MDIAVSFISDFFYWLRYDFWYFIRPFIYGGFGGLSLFLMSYITNESNNLHKRNEVILRGFEANRLDEVNKRSKNFLVKAMGVYYFVSGVSGMIAVNAFNSSAGELQTFSIAAIAGLGGFAFLKRSAIVDDNDADSILDVEALEIIDEFGDFVDTLNEFEKDINQFVDWDELGDFLADDTDAANTEKNMDDFLGFLQSEFGLEQDEMELLAVWVEEGLTQDEITNRLLNYLDS